MMRTAWGLLTGAAAASALLALVAAGVTLAASDASLRAGLAFGALGLALLRGAVAYGVWLHARWALWVGGLLALLNLLLPLLSLGVQVEATGTKLELTGASAILAWLLALCGLTFLAGLGMLAVNRKQA